MADAGRLISSAQRRQLFVLIGRTFNNPKVPALDKPGLCQTMFKGGPHCG